MLVHVPKRLEQLSCCHQWKNFKRLPVLTDFMYLKLSQVNLLVKNRCARGITQPMRSLCKMYVVDKYSCI